ncbi:MAG: histidinol-phosphate transaminase [Pirellulales bacterium]
MNAFFRPEILAMAGYTPGEQPQGGKFIKLNTNENPYPASPAVTRALHEAVDAGLARYPDPLATAFRMQAAQVLGVEPDWILCGNGSDDILTIVTRALVGPGQILRLPYPSYILYRTLAELQGARSQEVRFERDWTLPEAFGQADPELRLAFLPNPNSPTGTVVSAERLTALADSLPCPLLVDEAYADFAEDSAVRLVRANPKIMVSRTLSKSYALAGLRFGFLVAHPELIQQFIKVKDSYNCDALSIAGATAALADQKWLAENRARVIATRTRMTETLRQWGFDVPDSQANFVWATCATRELRPLYERLKAQRILVRYMNYAGWGEGLRISVGTDDQTDACLAMLKSLL